MCANAHGSVSPISGQYSNFTERANSKPFDNIRKNDTLKTKINLIVTKNQQGQQFILQCANNDQLGFGTVTEFKTLRSKAIIKAGQYCPFKEAEVEFDYDWVVIRANGKFGLLIQGAINVPVTE